MSYYSLFCSKYLKSWTCYILVALFFANCMILLNHQKCAKLKTKVLKYITEPVKSHKSLVLLDIKNFNVARWDNQRSYRIYDNVFVGEPFGITVNKYNVSIATQSNLERLSILPELLVHWTGPISLTLYAADNTELNLLNSYLYFLEQCYKIKSKPLVIHLVLPKNGFPFKLNPMYNFLQPIECVYPDKIFPLLVDRCTNKTSQWYLDNPYPQNLLRNVARKNCPTSNVLLTDIDILPSYGMADMLNNFLETTNCTSGKCVYAIPTYEIDESVIFPENKQKLLSYIRSGKAQSFHQKIYTLNQYAINSPRWENFEEPKDGISIHISHDVPTFQLSWEPFYVAPDTVPPHDERFLGFGYTRNTQVYETLLAGYKFFVLSPIFFGHWGFQSVKTRPDWREKQIESNGHKMSRFFIEMNIKYKKK